MCTLCMHMFCFDLVDDVMPLTDVWRFWPWLCYWWFREDEYDDVNMMLIHEKYGVNDELGSCNHEEFDLFDGF